jgi:hypothetical protein
VRSLLVALANFLNAIAGHRQEAHGAGIFGIKPQTRIVAFVTVITFRMSV